MVFGSGLTPVNVILTRSTATPNDIAIGFFGQTGTLTLKDQFGAYDAGIEQIRFADGTVWTDAELINAYLTKAQTAGADTILGVTGYAGTLTVTGFADADTFTDVGTYFSSAVDVLAFGPAITTANIKLTRSAANPSDIVIGAVGQTGTLTLKDQFGAYDAGIEQIRFADGTVWTDAELINEYAARAQSPGNDTTVGAQGSIIFPDDNLDGNAVLREASVSTFSTGRGTEIAVACTQTGGRNSLDKRDHFVEPVAFTKNLAEISNNNLILISVMAQFAVRSSMLNTVQFDRVSSNQENYFAVASRHFIFD